MSPQSMVLARSVTRALARFSIVFFVATGASLATAAPPAMAAKNHAFIRSFGPDGSSATSFSYAASVAVDQQTHDVYVADIGDGAVYRFNENGSPLDFTGTAPDISANEITGISFRSGEGESQIAVDSQTGTLYVASINSILAIQESGEPADFTASEPYIPTNGHGEDENKITGFGELLGVAVDENGDIYAGDYSGHVDVYAPSGKLLTSFASANAGNLAVDSHGAVYVNHWHGSVEKYTPSAFPVTAETEYTSAGVIDPHQAFTLAVEPGSGALYVDKGSNFGLVEYPPAGGAPLDEFADSGPGEIVGSLGIAVDGASGIVYATAREKVMTFSPLVAFTVTTGEPTNATQTEATLSGTVDPPAGGPAVTGCKFEYGLKAGEYSLGTLECEPKPPYSSSTSVTANLSGLTPETTYHYRLAASSSEGTSYGEDHTLRPHAVQGLTTAPATDVTSSTATLNGSWTGNNEDTHYYFEWGKTSAYGNATVLPPGSDGGAGVGVQSGAFDLTGLRAEAVYHYRIIASNSMGTTIGPDRTFETIGVPIFSFISEPSTALAGGHPDIITLFHYGDRLNSVGGQEEDEEPSENECGCADVEHINIHSPAGVIASPHNVPQCTRVTFALNQCPPSTQVGWAPIGLPRNFIIVPAYNVETGPDIGGLVAFNASLIRSPIFVVFSSRTGGDYGLNEDIFGVEHRIPFVETGLTLWGVPAEHSHDTERFPTESVGCIDHFPCFAPNTSNAEEAPFIDGPTTCGEPLSSSLTLETYNLGITKASAPWPATNGCDQLSFNPSLYAQPTTKQADSASGLDVDLSVPQLVSPTSPAPSEIRALTVKLPKGMSINPNAADGKSSCSDAEARFGTEEEAQCPEFSKVGTATLDSSALAGPIPGSVYIGEPKPGNRYRLILTANGFATHVKLAGTVEPDPQTGQLLVSFQNLPQAPFSEFDLHFFGSERGLLATPTQCGTYPVQSTFTPWDSALSAQTSTQYFKIEEGPGGSSCPPSPRPFNPAFTAAVSESTAGAHTPFSLELTRNDGDQDLSALNVTTPPGFSATLKGIPYCSEAALAAAANASYSGLEEEANPSCPAASQIGIAQAGSGAGTHPVYLPGKVYLAGPYQGAPLSLAVITPAVSGPYDLGNVVVRAALHVNPETAQITAVSDPLPKILQGIPLRLRSIRIDLNRPNFALNPTNCDPFSVTTEVFGEEGAVAKPSPHFQVANCRVLGFAPKLSMRFTGSTKRAGVPSLHAILAYPPGNGYANTGRAVITLPPTEIVDNAHINNPCTRVVFAEGSTPGEKCPAGSVLGFAKAETPLLEKSLEGPVYLRSSGRHLPDIVAALNGQIDLTLDGRIDTLRNGAIRTSFENTPDAPVSSFTLILDGGAKGLLQNNTPLCKHTLHVTADITGQNGKTANQNPVLSTPCAKKHKRKHTRHRRSDQGGRR